MLDCSLTATYYVVLWESRNLPAAEPRKSHPNPLLASSGRWNRVLDCRVGAVDADAARMEKATCRMGLAPAPFQAQSSPYHPLEPGGH